MRCDHESSLLKSSDQRIGQARCTWPTRRPPLNSRVREIAIWIIMAAMGPRDHHHDGLEAAAAIAIIAASPPNNIANRDRDVIAAAIVPTIELDQDVAVQYVAESQCATTPSSSRSSIS